MWNPPRLLFGLDLSQHEFFLVLRAGQCINLVHSGAAASVKQALLWYQFYLLKTDRKIMIASALINFLKFIGKSVLASVIIFIVSLSVMTQKFPPDFTQVKSTYEIFKNLQSLSRKKSNAVQAALPSDSSAVASTDEDDIQQLIQLRQKIVMPLTGITDSLSEEKASKEEPPSCQYQVSLIQQLQSKIEELDKQNLSLNKKILELKYSKQ